MLCLDPGPPSLLHLTWANAIKPYAGDTISIWSVLSKIRNSRWVSKKAEFDADFESLEKVVRKIM